MSAKRILITGGAGFIGSRLARRLQQDAHSVLILDNLLPQVHGDSPRPLQLDCEFIRADVRDMETVAHAMHGVDVVHHLAAETGVGQSQYEIGRYVSANTYGTAVVLEAAAVAQVRQVVIASSRAVYGEGQHRCAECRQTFTAESRRVSDTDAGIWNIPCPKCGQESLPLPMAETAAPAPSSIYGITKLQQEQLALNVSYTHDLAVTVLRFFNVFGPGQSLRNPYVGVLGTFFRRAMSHSPVEVYEDGKMLRDFVYVGDVVEAMGLCTGNERVYGRTLNVGTGKAVTLLEVATEVFHALHLEPQITVSGRYRQGDVRHAVAEASLLDEVLGFHPRTSFAQGVRTYVQWALENPSDASDTIAEDQLTARNLLRQALATRRS